MSLRSLICRRFETHEDKAASIYSLVSLGSVYDQAVAFFKTGQWWRTGIFCVV
jgi:hypothetical protein